MVLLNTVIGPIHNLFNHKYQGKGRRDIPVTPAMVSGWAPKTENMKAAMNDASNTSATPYC